MTIVEFFDCEPISNTYSMLAFRPSRIIFLTDKPIDTSTQQRYRQLADSVNLRCDIRFCSINTASLTDSIAVLDDIVRTESEVSFDITGGNEALLAAAGAIVERYRDNKPIRLHRVDVKTGQFFDLVTHSPLAVSKPQLTVAQLVALHNGAVGGHPNGGMPTEWVFSEDFKRTVALLWGINRENPSLYNKCISRLQSFEKLKESASPLQIVINKSILADQIERYEEKMDTVDTFLHRLAQHNLITLQPRDGYLSFTYRDTQTRKCLAKAGNLLELKTLSIALSLRDEQGAALINDARCGVHIDWDGHFTDTAVDTVNEIDVLLMNGTTPIFISCKNGSLDDKELYKLHVVAQRFGGKYAKAVLTATYIERNPMVKAALLQRAQDMNIAVIGDVHRLSDAEFEARLRKEIYR